MFGAILGDMIGAPYEFDRGDKTKDFPLFCEESLFTDDSVMTAAVAEALLDTLGGDCDTLACIAGSIAEAFYGIPTELLETAVDGLTEDMLEVERRLYRAAAKNVG